MDPQGPTPHYLLALTYRRMGEAQESQTEMGMFEKILPQQYLWVDSGSGRRPSV